MMKNFLAGIIISPIFAMLGIVISNALILKIVTPEMFLYFTFISYISMGIIGIPLLLFLNYKKWSQWWQFCLAGIFAGFLSLLALLIPAGIANFVESLKFFISKNTVFLPISAMIGGLAGGYSFWLISMRKTKIEGKT